MSGKWMMVLGAVLPMAASASAVSPKAREALPLMTALAEMSPLAISNCDGWDFSRTTSTGKPDKQLWALMQCIARMHGYTGPIDGVMGPNSWKGVQKYLKVSWGYTGPTDGVPGANTYRAMQRSAAWWGYTGPIDGVMGPNSWKYWARQVNAISAD